MKKLSITLLLSVATLSALRADCDSMLSENTAPIRRQEMFQSDNLDTMAEMPAEQTTVTNQDGLAGGYAVGIEVIEADITPVDESDMSASTMQQDRAPLSYKNKAANKSDVDMVAPVVDTTKDDTLTAQPSKDADVEIDLEEDFDMDDKDMPKSAVTYKNADDYEAIK
ncbi:hypothetical protein H0X48_06770 [Candidatus Dependentiae bacterium]|nr:hypothetical protein [Candidatus Dependentiae bacterium]